MKKYIVLIVSLGILSIFAGVANAYSLNGTKWPYGGGGVDLNLTYMWGPSTSVWKTAFTSGASDWSATLTPVNYSYNSSSQNKLGVVDIPGGAYGYNWQYSTAGFITNFDAAGNTATTSSFTSTMRRSTGGHELAHGFGLGDIYTSNPVALMDGNRNRATIYTPRADDITGTKQIYPGYPS